MTALSTPLTVWFPANPPLSAGPVTVSNGHVAVNGQRVTFFGVNYDFQAILSLLNPMEVSGQAVVQIDPSQQAVFTAQLNNLVACGIRAVRIHGLDCEGQANIFNASGNCTTTRKLDPAAMHVLSWFISQLETRNIRYTLDLHYTRQLTADDGPPAGTTDPLFTECLSQGYISAPAGLMMPWVFYETGANQGWLWSLMVEYVTNLLSFVNPFTGNTIGKGPGLMSLGLENEQSLAKTAAWSYDAHPNLNAAFNAATAAWCAANNIASNKFGNVEHYEFAAWQETEYFTQLAAVVQPLAPNALIICGNYFGNGPYAMLHSLAAVGDIVDCHFYSYYSASEQIANGGPGNGFLCGQTASSEAAAPPSARSRFAAVLAGCAISGLPQASGAGATLPLPQFVTEWAPVPQYKINGNFVQDPPAERSLVLAAMVQAAIAQDVDAIFLYSDAHNPIMAEGSPYATFSAYDFRVDPVLCQGMPSQAAAFHDLSLRPASSVALEPTDGVFGLENGTIYGPYTDPALYAVAAGTKVQVAR